MLRSQAYLSSVTCVWIIPGVMTNDRRILADNKKPGDPARPRLGRYLIPSPYWLLGCLGSGPGVLGGRLRSQRLAQLRSYKAAGNASDVLSQPKFLLNVVSYRCRLEMR